MQLVTWLLLWPVSPRWYRLVNYYLALLLWAQVVFVADWWGQLKVSHPPPLPGPAPVPVRMPACESGAAQMQKALWDREAPFHIQGQSLARSLQH